MKKSFLFLLISIMTVFLIAGCAEENKNNGNTTTGTEVTPELIQQLKSYAGDYEITFFHTDGGGFLSISSNCNDVITYTGKADTKCVSGTNDVTMKGYGTITVADNGDVTVITKMQMTNASLQNPTGLWAAAKNNQYNYTVFTTIPASTIDLNTMTLNAINPVSGVTGRNLTLNTNYPNNTYTFTLMSDGSIKNNLVDTSSGIANANVTVIMNKVTTSIPSGYTLEKDVKFPEPVIDSFVDAPAN